MKEIDKQISKCIKKKMFDDKLLIASSNIQPMSFKRVLIAC